MVPSVMIRSGRNARTLSGEIAWPLPVTTGRSSTPGKVVEISRPTRFSPKPSAHTVAASDPDMSRASTRPVERISTDKGSPSSSEVTVEGRVCGGAVAGATISARDSSAVLGPSYFRGLARNLMSLSASRSPATGGSVGVVENDAGAHAESPVIRSPVTARDWIRRRALTVLPAYGAVPKTGCGWIRWG